MYFFNISAGKNSIFQARDIGFHHVFVPFDREDQRNIHIDAGSDRGSDGRESRFGSGYLDHQVRAVYFFPQF